MQKLKLELERMLICLILIYYNQMLLYSCIFGLWHMCLWTKVAIRTCLASKLPSGCSSLSETVRGVLRPLDIKVVSTHFTLYAINWFAPRTLYTDGPTNRIEWCIRSSLLRLPLSVHWAVWQEPEALVV